MKTMLNVKLDKTLKDNAQKIAKELGLPLSVVVSNYLREFVQEGRIVFSSHPTPNTKTQRVLDQALEDIRNNKNLSPGFSNAKDAIRHLEL